MPPKYLFKNTYVQADVSVHVWAQVLSIHQTNKHQVELII